MPLALVAVLRMAPGIDAAEWLSDRAAGPDLVGGEGFEPPTSSMSSWRSSN